eukprot:685412-Pyramimonas_sp.AAC.1
MAYGDAERGADCDAAAAVPGAGAAAHHRGDAHHPEGPPAAAPQAHHGHHLRPRPGGHHVRGGARCQGGECQPIGLDEGICRLPSRDRSPPQ